MESGGAVPSWHIGSGTIVYGPFVGRPTYTHWSRIQKLEMEYMKKIDPTERALDAYFELDESQRRVFAAAIKHVERYAQSSAAPEPAKRGRPAGSRNRNAHVVEALSKESV